MVVRRVSGVTGSGWWRKYSTCVACVNRHFQKGLLHVVGSVAYFRCNVPGTRHTPFGQRMYVWCVSGDVVYTSPRCPRHELPPPEFADTCHAL
jgi:hypothetical protein